MKKRSLLLINAVVILLVMILSGCGGGGGDAEISTTSAPGTEPPGTVVPAGGAAATTGVKTQELPVPRKYEVTEETPTFFREAIDKKQPVFLMFYSARGIDSIKQRDELKPIYDKFNNQVLFLAIDIEESEKISKLADQFGVGDVPHIAILDKEGNVIREFKGSFTDGKVIEQIIYSIVNS